MNTLLTEEIWCRYMHSKNIKKINLPILSKAKQQKGTVKLLYNNQVKGMINDGTTQLLATLEKSSSPMTYHYLTPIFTRGTEDIIETSVCGIEMINAQMTDLDALETLILMALDFFKTLGYGPEDFLVDLGNVAIVKEMLKGQPQAKALLEGIDNKNIRALETLLDPARLLPWQNLIRLNGLYEEVAAAFAPDLYENPGLIEDALTISKDFQDRLLKKCPLLDLRFDFTFTNRFSYYDRYIFKIYDKKTKSILCFGGRYNSLSQSYGFKSGIGMSIPLQNIQNRRSS